jgi:hypothetical protein
VADDPNFEQKALQIGREAGDLEAAKIMGYCCHRCGGRFRLKDGVLYCRECLLVYVRTGDNSKWGNSKKFDGKIVYMCREAGWNWKQIRRITGGHIGGLMIIWERIHEEKENI